MRAWITRKQVSSFICHIHGYTEMGLKTHLWSETLPDHSASSVIQDRNFLSHQGFPEDAHGGQFLCDKLLSLRVFNVPGRLNLGTDMLSRGNVASGEWTLHPHILSIFGGAEVNPFASEDNSHCPSYFSMQRDALVHDWPSAHLYAFPPIALLPQVIKRVREVKCSVLPVAPLWRNQT